MAAYDKKSLTENKAVAANLQAAQAHTTGLRLLDNRPQSIVQKKQADALANKQAAEARVVQKQERVKPNIQVKTKADVNTDKGAKVVQRAIHLNPILYTNTLGPADITKLTAVVAHLTASLANDHSEIRHLDINIHNMRGINPADTKRVNPATIEINLAAWFVKASAIGEIAGLIVHEIGVHTLADAHMGMVARVAEVTENRNEHIKTGVHTHDLPRIAPRDDREKDHINVVKDTGRGPQPMHPRGGPSRRTRVYVNTMLAVGDTIDAHATLTPPQKDKQLQDLLATFLFDYARMLATDDGGGVKIFVKAYLISQVINWYRATVIRRYSATHAWLTRPALQPTSSGWGLRAYLLSRLSAWLIFRLRSSRVGALAGRGITGVTNMGRATGRMVGAAAGRLAPVGNLIGAVAGPVAHPIGRMVARAARAGGRLATGIGNFVAPAARVAGNVIGSTLRVADHIEGEGENLVQNVVGLGVSAVSGAVGLGASAVSGLWGLGKSMFGR